MTGGPPASTLPCEAPAAESFDAAMPMTESASLPATKPTGKMTAAALSGIPTARVIALKGLKPKTHLP